jgi:hypothetical protein
MNNPLHMNTEAYDATARDLDQGERLPGSDGLIAAVIVCGLMGMAALLHLAWVFMRWKGWW